MVLRITTLLINIKNSTASFTCLFHCPKSVNSTANTLNLCVRVLHNYEHRHLHIVRARFFYHQHTIICAIQHQLSFLIIGNDAVLLPVLFALFQNDNWHCTALQRNRTHRIDDDERCRVAVIRPHLNLTICVPLLQTSRNREIVGLYGSIY